MTSFTRDRRLDATLQLILASFSTYQQEGVLSDDQIAGTFLGLIGQLQWSSQLTVKQRATCKAIYQLVARRHQPKS